MLIATSGLDLKYQSLLERKFGKMASRRTKLANFINNQLASLIEKPFIEVLFESELRAGEKEGDRIKISVIDQVLRDVIVQIVVWLRRDHPVPICSAPGTFSSSLLNIRMVGELDCRNGRSWLKLYADTEEEARLLVSDVTVAVERRLAARPEYLK